jgi:glycine amidinotransferase
MHPTILESRVQPLTDVTSASLAAEGVASAEAQSPSPVCSWNEWDPLEEVIVGTARGSVRSAWEPAAARPSEKSRMARADRFGQEEIDEAERQLDGFAALLEREGVVVRRPDPVDQLQGVVTPDFECQSGNAQACPRDVLLVVGDEIIEAPMSRRARYFEYRAYRSLLKEYFRQGARWTAAPKPTMGDRLYVPGYDTEADPFDFSTHRSLTEFEPCFDAACFCRMGRDIFWQPDIVSNQFGIDWLQRHLGPTFRIHKVEFHEPRPHHVDTTLVPLRPGLAFVCPARPRSGR